MIQINTEASFEILKMLNLQLLSSDPFLCFYNRKSNVQRDQSNLSRVPEESRSSTPVVHAGMASLITSPFRNFLQSNCCYQHRWQIKVLVKTRSAQLLPQTDLQKPMMDRGTKTSRTAPLCWSPVGIYPHPRTKVMARGRALGSPRRFWEALLFPMTISFS